MKLNITKVANSYSLTQDCEDCEAQNLNLKTTLMETNPDYCPQTIKTKNTFCNSGCKKTYFIESDNNLFL